MCNVDKTELKNPQKQLAALDKDKNKTVSMDEFLAREVKKFNNQDDNKNGVLLKDEIKVKERKNKKVFSV